jgi:hypothetical protein
LFVGLSVKSVFLNLFSMHACLHSSTCTLKFPWISPK